MGQGVQDGDSWVEGAAGVRMLGMRSPPRRLWGPGESEAARGAGEGGGVLEGCRGAPGAPLHGAQRLDKCLH